MWWTIWPNKEKKEFVKSSITEGQKYFNNYLEMGSLFDNDWGGRGEGLRFLGGEFDRDRLDPEVDLERLFLAGSIGCKPFSIFGFNNFGFESGGS